MGIKDYLVYLNGSPIAANSFCNDMDISEDSFHEQYFYNEYLKAYGKTAMDITPERWRKDLFILTTHLSVNPVINDKGVVRVNNSDTHLSPINGSMIDVELGFKPNSLTESCIVHFLAVLDCVFSFSVNGEPL